MKKTYQNPVRPGFFPDPSIVRVGDDFYMVNSTFQYFPAVVVSHSRDLVHWRALGHVVTDPSALNLLSVGDSCGVWAPDISYHEGIFFVFFPFATRDGDQFRCVNYVCTATRPEGPWTAPVCLGEGGIDPSHFVDDDGKHYMLTSPAATITPLSDDGLRTTGEPVMLWPGITNRAPEGPHVLKREGYYYLMLAEGGTSYDHRITVARSRSLYGPYEGCPRNPVLMQTDRGATIQKTGHGKWVQTQDGDWWVTYLCGRPLDGRHCPLGRETALDPLTWREDGWPEINGGRGPSTEQTRPLPEHRFEENAVDDFSDPVPGPQWQFIRNMDPAGWSLVQRPGHLRLYTSGAEFQQLDRPVNALVRRETSHRYAASATLRLSASGAGGGEAGVTCYYGWRNHVRFGVTWARDRRIRLVENRAGTVRVLAEEPLPDGEVLCLKVEVDGFRRGFSRSVDGGDFVPVGEIGDARFLSDEGVVGEYGFTGTMVGMYAMGGEPGSREYADFDRFDYVPARVDGSLSGVEFPPPAI